MLRLLFDGPRPYQYLENHVEMDRPRLLRALSNLRAHNDIKGKKIYLKKDNPVEVSVSKIVAGMFGVDADVVNDVEVSTYCPFTHVYNITKKQGVSKLIYYEWRFGMFRLWVPEGHEGYWQDKYESEIAEQMKEQGFYKKSIR